MLRTFASGFDHSRFELHMIGLRPALNSPLPEELRALGVPVLELDQRNSYDLPAFSSLLAYLRRHRIDIIHTHLLASDIMGRMAGFLTHRPVISTIHNSRKDLDMEPLRRQMMQRWTARFMCNKLIVVSDLIHDEIVDWFGLPPDRVVIIPNGVDMDRFYRGPEFDRAAMKHSLVGGEFPVVTNVARLVPEKGQNYLIEAAQIVTKVRPEVRFIMLGDGPLMADLEAQVESLGIADKVIFTGFRNDVADVLAASNVFVLSSLWEGMPVSLLEAMAAGCPAVSTHVGGVGQVLQHNVNGLMVPPADPQALADALLQFLDNPDLAHQMSAIARDWVNERYSMHAWVHKCEALYLEELALSRAMDKGVTAISASTSSPNSLTLLPTGGKLKVELIKDQATFARMQNEWDDLVERSNASVFNSWAWLYPWYQWLSPSRELRALTARDESNQLVGLMPLYLECRRIAGRKVRRLAFLGDKYVGSEYLDVVATCDHRETATKAFASALYGARSTWDVLDLLDLDSESPTIQTLRAFFAARLFDVHINEGSVCPFETFVEDAGFDSFLRTTRRRSNYIRRRNWLQKQPGYRIEKVEDPERFGPAMGHFFRLHGQRWASAGGSDAITGPRLKAFHRLASHLLAQRKHLRMYTMMLGDTAVASVYGIRHRSKFIYYQSGRDPNWEDRSVGLVLVGETFKDAIEEGMSEYDFLRGSEPFKSDWTKNQRRTVAIRIHQRSLRGNLLDVEEQSTKALRVFAKKALPEELVRKAQRLRLAQARVRE